MSKLNAYRIKEICEYDACLNHLSIVNINIKANYLT